MRDGFQRSIMEFQNGGTFVRVLTGAAHYGWQVFGEDGRGLLRAQIVRQAPCHTGNMAGG